MTTVSSAFAPIGVLLTPLGTPDAPTARALRPYLAEFLSDRRVIDYPAWLWQPLLRGIILNVRPRRSAALYARIWTEAGSPLRVIAHQQADGLQDRLGEAYRVRVGMRYGGPSIADVMSAFATEGIEQVIVLPMYPQYSSTTSASIYDGVYDTVRGGRFVPALSFVPPHYDHQGYIAALAATARRAIESIDAQHFVMSFHGIPRRYIRTGDPYQAQCAITARLLADALGLPADRWTQTFQSQFGPEKWIGPDTEETLEHLAKTGTTRVAIACPGFTQDCLETLDEIGNEGREAFIHAGGEAYALAECVNAHPLFLDALADLVRCGGQCTAASDRCRIGGGCRLMPANGRAVALNAPPLYGETGTSVASVIAENGVKLA